MKTRGRKLPTACAAIVTTQRICSGENKGEEAPSSACSDCYDLKELFW